MAGYVDYLFFNTKKGTREMNANELADVFDTYAEPHDWGKQAATMLRQQQAEMEELEKENTDLRYLIATKLEQQNGISLNSMAHPITNTPEPSYEIDLDKLETIEIDLPSPEPVAWMIQYKDRHKFVFEKPTYSEHILACEPLYTHQRPHNTVLVPCDKLTEMQAEIEALKKHNEELQKACVDSLVWVMGNGVYCSLDIEVILKNVLGSEWEDYK